MPCHVTLEVVLMVDDLSRQSLPISVRRRVLEAGGNRCHYCGSELPPPGRQAQVDHRKPARRGGGDEEANLVPACGSCNAAKGAMAEDRFREYVVQRSVAWRAATLLSAILAVFPEWHDMPALWLLIRLAGTGRRFSFPGVVREILARAESKGDLSDAWLKEKQEAAVLVLMKAPERGWGRGRHGDDD